MVALGVALRAGLWLLAGESELQSDEAGYLHLAVQWKQLGFYPDSFRFLWPPGYPAYLRACLEAFGPGALDAARIGQIVASASTGLSTGLIAWRLFGRGPAALATAGWALYLPLAAFTHLLWNETLFLALFLPALYQAISVCGEPEAARATRRLIVCGLCVSAALLVKEAATFLLPVWALVLACTAASWSEGFRRASLLALVVAACVTPWGLRNLEVYGRFIPLGSSLGENAYNGLNATYRNFDLIPLDVERMRRGMEPLTPRPFGTAPPEGAEPWGRAEEIANLPARMDENTRRGLAFAAEHPGWLLRSRLQKISDALVPTTFLTRHLALGHYAGPLGSGTLRAAAAWGSALQVVLLLALGGAGLIAGLRRQPARWLVAGTLLYFLATTMLVSMSRFRLPVVPLLLAGAAAALCRPRLLRQRALPVGLWWAALILAWWCNAPVLAQVWPMVLGTGEGSL